MKAIDALARYLWEQGLGVSTTPWDPPGHLVVRDGDYTRLLLPHEVEAMAAALWALGLMDWKGRPITAQTRVLAETEHSGTLWGLFRNIAQHLAGCSSENGTG